jgi:CRP-like cAMP-binding protein
MGLGAIDGLLLVVHSGWLVQRVIHHSGEELIVSILGRSDAAGLPELVLSRPAEKETMAGADSILISIPLRAIVDLPISSRDHWSRINRELARESLELLQKLATFSFCSLEGRIAAFLLDAQRIFRRTPSLKLTQEMIAKAVGGSRPKVNRCLRALERRGTIAWHNGSVPEIQDRAALARLF